jgi:hypothetical protein
MGGSTLIAAAGEMKESAAAYRAQSLAPHLGLQPLDIILIKSAVDKKGSSASRPFAMS